MMRRKTRVVERYVSTPDYKSKQYDVLVHAIEQECSEHIPRPDANWGPGWSGNIRFWCTVCRTPWPCRFLVWASKCYGLEEWDGQPLVYRVTRRDDETDDDG